MNIFSSYKKKAGNQWVTKQPPRVCRLGEPCTSQPQIKKKTSVRFIFFLQVYEEFLKKS